MPEAVAAELVAVVVLVAEPEVIELLMVFPQLQVLLFQVIILTQL